MTLSTLLPTPAALRPTQSGIDRRGLALVRSIRAESARLVSASDRELQDRVADLRATPLFRRPRDERVARTTLFALVTEAIRRALGVNLYDVQLLAGEALACGCIGEMQTGEGKTLAITLPACWFALTGEGVHVVTANAYLAARDLQLLQPAYECLGLTAALLPERAGPDEKRQAYAREITYGTGYEFGFDFLRDQLGSDAESQGPPGGRYLRRLRSLSPIGSRIQRGLAHAIVDEVDNVLLDDAVSPLVIAGANEGEAPDATAHRLAWELSEQLSIDVDFTFDAAGGRLSLTATGLERVHSTDVAVPLSVLQRPWADYVQQALRARHLFVRDVHYVVRDDDVQIVDGSTGRIFEDRTWQDGLHQAIEAKESQTIKTERRPLAGITRQRYFRLYRRLCGVTGTARGAEREFQDVYGLPVRVIPLHRQSQFQAWRPRHFVRREASWDAALERIRELTGQGRPILIGAQTIHDSEALSERLTAAEIEHHVLNGRQDADEADVIALAGQPSRVTISTNLAGRGTDIRLSPAAAAAGGLHVIACGRHRARRIDRQLIGRSARQGAPGSAEFLICADDALIAENAPWLSRRIVSRSNACGAACEDFTGAIDRIQRRVERNDTTARRLMLKRDLERETVLGELESIAHSEP